MRRENYDEFKLQKDLFVLRIVGAIFIFAKRWVPSIKIYTKIHTHLWVIVDCKINRRWYLPDTHNYSFFFFLPPRSRLIFLRMRKSQFVSLTFLIVVVIRKFSSFFVCFQLLPINTASFHQKFKVNTWCRMQRSTEINFNIAS